MSYFRVALQRECERRQLSQADLGRNANPALAGTILVAGIIGVLAWIWWPGGFLLP